MKPIKFENQKCPKCGNNIIFVGGYDVGIDVNIESKGTYPIEEFFRLLKKCDNPLCEWSRINGMNDSN